MFQNEVKKIINKLNRCLALLPSAILLFNTKTGQACFVKGSNAFDARRYLVKRTGSELVLGQAVQSNECDNFTNGRLISILPSFSKFLESAVFSRLMQYLTNFNILCSNQYDFRKIILLHLHGSTCIIRYPRPLSSVFFLTSKKPLTLQIMPFFFIESDNTVFAV